MNQIHPDPTARPPAVWAVGAESRSAGNLEEVMKFSIMRFLIIYFM